MLRALKIMIEQGSHFELGTVKRALQRIERRHFGRAERNGSPRG